jgi:hypothetical protein
MVSDTVGPLPSLAALCAAGAIGSSPVAGIGWGLLAMFFVAILPYVATWKIRHPAEGGRLSVSVRAGYMGLAALTAAVGLLMLWLLGAPSQLVATVIAILVTLVVVAVTNALGDEATISPQRRRGGQLVVLPMASLFAMIAIPPVAWARLKLGRHSTVELAAGTAVGVVVAELCWLLCSRNPARQGRCLGRRSNRSGARQPLPDRLGTERERGRNAPDRLVLIRVIAGRLAEFGDLCIGENRGWDSKNRRRARRLSVAEVGLVASPAA